MQLKKQQKNNRTLTLFLTALLLASLHTIGLSKNRPEKKINLKHILRFESLKPTINPTYLFVYHHALAVDKEGNIYYCESDRHRIMKFSREGKFIKQIGKIGKSEDGLFYPKTILIKDNLLHVLDDGIKVFDLEGNFKHHFQFQGEHIGKKISYSLFAMNDNRIFVDVKYFCKNFNDMPLITAFNLAGKKMETFGRTIPATRYIEYKYGNPTIIQLHENKIYGTFGSYPGIFCYSLEGEEILFKSLEKIDIDDKVNAFLRKKIKGQGKDEGPNRVMIMNYIDGFWVNQNEHYFLFINNHKQKDFYILELDSNGVPTLKLRADYQGKPIWFKRILNGVDGRLYVIACQSSNESYLFEWIDNYSTFERSNN